MIIDKVSKEGASKLQAAKFTEVARLSRSIGVLGVSFSTHIAGVSFIQWTHCRGVFYSMDTLQGCLLFNKHIAGVSLIQNAYLGDLDLQGVL